MDPTTILRDEERAWLALTLFGALTLAVFATSGFVMHWASVVATGGTALALAILGLRFRRRCGDDRIGATCATLGQLIPMTACAACLSYLAACTAAPYVDADLYRVDHMFGFDWRGYVAAIDARPALGRLLAVAYGSLMPQMALTLTLLGFTGRMLQLRMLAWAATLGVIVAVLVSAMLPAQGNYAYLGLKPASFPHLQIGVAFEYLKDLALLRHGGPQALGAVAFKGVISFPSYHATLAVLFGWALWQNRVTRWLGVALEALVLAATPVYGGHYLIDVIAGVAVAAGSLVAARRLVLSAEPRTATEPSTRLSSVPITA